MYTVHDVIFFYVLFGYFSFVIKMAPFVVNNFVDFYKMIYQVFDDT